MKKKLTMMLALAAALVLLASAAVAAGMLNYSPEVAAQKQAVQALYEHYGLSRSSLGLFKAEILAENQTMRVHFQADAYLPAERIGEYDVVIADGAMVISWTHDDKDPALWQSGDPEALYWGEKQLQAYLAVDPRERSAWLAAYVAKEESASPAATPAAESAFVTVPLSDADLPLAQAMAHADAALMDVYGMTEADIAAIDHDVYACITIENGRRLWDLTYGDAEGMYYIRLDASTGEIIDIGMTTGGNG